MINCVFAVDYHGGMGFYGTLPWPHNAEDLANFKKLTKHNVVVMGRKTWDDPKMPKPLNQREVYVASNSPVRYAGQISGDLSLELLELEKKHSNQIIWVVGGPQILESCRSLFDQIHLTHFNDSYKVDTKIDLKTFLTGFTPRLATTALDSKSVFIRYESIFKRSNTSP